ncbi:hypothetical protein CALCODRAFT_156506 [Calocera cornea HHB12733]|uniref:WW domain-containing protein n=1 Tax=Calocera cornea HHB12733 TaxID=1353952 RepID=A0A165HZ73_9BASI|nr:hypothetical protein CALCODRAFT_156506 [Calocera cornea HHB12733]
MPAKRKSAKRKAVSQPEEERAEKRVAMEPEPVEHEQETTAAAVEVVGSPPTDLTTAELEKEEEDPALAKVAEGEQVAEVAEEEVTGGDGDGEAVQEDPEAGEQEIDVGAHEPDEHEEPEDREEAEDPASAPAPAPATEPAEPAPASTSAPADPAAPVQTDWQAVWAPAYNAYYFYNGRTGETTWVNPLDPASQTPAHAQAHGSTSGAASTSAGMPGAALGAAGIPAAASAATNPWAAPPSNALSEGIDPLLYHLDPTLALSSSSSGGPAGSYAAQARFNAHTGRFEADPTKRPERMSEFERAKRMSEVYFDTDKWEREVEERKRREEEEGKARKRPTKKDLERFAEAKKRKKLAKTAWLRN